MKKVPKEIQPNHIGLGQVHVPRPCLFILSFYKACSPFFLENKRQTSHVIV